MFWVIGVAQRAPPYLTKLTKQDMAQSFQAYARVVYDGLDKLITKAGKPVWRWDLESFFKRIKGRVMMWSHSCNAMPVQCYAGF
ncbi:hypothetical protein XBKB1_4010036 [Xenorhabdus bovienii str. kraussei Becker Underwood]|uniref:Uncharacterized protein n=1 Tax=Xenorhabdus bovienii str. kraussei Becker Underwood TaxID=1398204 RepID=A0A077PWG4_XENBV|nr:hypothetical protein XBKB1_4010036 [Xenorhabdus bovienii str. kraussei Becker Underwood]